MDNKPPAPIIFPTNFERAIYDGIIKGFFTGITSYNEQGFPQFTPAPMADVVARISREITPAVTEAIMREIDVEALAKEIGANISIKEIKTAVAKEIKAAFVKKLSR